MAQGNASGMDGTEMLWELMRRKWGCILSRAFQYFDLFVQTTSGASASQCHRVRCGQWATSARGTVVLLGCVDEGRFDCSRLRCTSLCGGGRRHCGGAWCYPLRNDRHTSEVGHLLPALLTKVPLWVLNDAASQPHNAAFDTLTHGCGPARFATHCAWVEWIRGKALHSTALCARGARAGGAGGGSRRWWRCRWR